MNKHMRVFLFIILISIIGSTKLFSQDKDVLFLVDDAASLSSSDAMIELMMTNSGYAVFTTTADNSVVGDTLDIELVVISSTVSSGDVRDKFKWIEIPILVWENGAFDDFGMTDTDLGSIALDVPVIDLVNDTHPLATGLTAGEITVLTQPGRFTHGSPYQAQGNSSVLLATLFDGTDDIGCWFVYEVGDSLAPETSNEDGFPADGLAMGMRIGLPFEDESFAYATPEAATILLNSMDYAVDGMIETVVPSAYVMIDGPDTLFLAKGQTSLNPAILFPSNVTDNVITFSSDNDAVAVYANGIVTAVESGGTYVFAESGGIMDSIFVQVKQPVQVTPDNLGIYMFEAEDFNSTQAAGGYQWEIKGDTLIPGFSGGLGIQSTPPDGDNFGNDGFESGSPYVTYDIDFQEAGMYYIWFRASSQGSENQNSFHAGMDNGTDTTLFVRVELIGEEEAGWQWGNELRGGDRVVYEVTEPGAHTFIIWNREAGTIIDKIAITGNADLQMSGMTDIVGFYSEFEAENFAFSNVVDTVYSWEIVDETLLPDMSEMHAVQASPGDSVNNFGNNSYVQDAPSMTYLVNFTEAGTYYFWVRAHTMGSGDKNSFHVGVSDGADTTFFTRVELGSELQTWQWGNELNSGEVVSIDITSPGLHEMIIWAREIGTVLDKFAFTTRENLMVSNVTPINNESFEIEAEDYSYTFEPDDVYSWELVGGDSLVSGMSNSLAIQALPEGENFGNSGYQTVAPSANYYVNFEQAGTYYYYARANSLGSGDRNSYHIGISNGTDTTSFTRAEVSSDSSDWQWSNMLDSGDTISYEVASPGLHEVIIWARETGIVIDKFILVPGLNVEPTVTLTPSLTTVEQGGDISLSAVAIDDIAIDHVEFFLDGQSIGIVNSEPFDLQYTIPNDVLGEVSFSAMASDMLGLTNADTVTVTVTEAAIGVDGVTLDQNAATIEVDATVQLIATVTPANAADLSVVWHSDDDNIAAVDNNGLVTGVAAGTTNVTVTTNDGGFTATAVITVTSDVSVSEILSDRRFNIYPNPVQDNLYIEGENIKTISIYNTTGSLMMVVDDNISNGINVSALESGLYIIKIEGSDFSVTSGFVKKQ
jgi:uncharacterized protein YjdB/plastocyanin